MTFPLDLPTGPTFEAIVQALKRTAECVVCDQCATTTTRKTPKATPAVRMPYND
jgi:hypothetical protein